MMENRNEQGGLTDASSKAASGDYLMLTTLLYCLLTHARIQFMYLLCIPI